MTLKELARHVTTEFKGHYGRPPRWIVAAPGRVNIIGEHTDYNEGFVLPMAIGRYAVMAADTSRMSEATVNIYDAHFKETAKIEVVKPIAKGTPKWSNYIRGVLAGFQNCGTEIPALDVAFMSTVPLGGGLSSSAALEVCTATLVEASTGKKIDPIKKALIAQKAEHDFVGVPCGIMDQFISVLGRESHLLLLDCRTRKTEQVPMDDPGVEFLIINTNVRHDLSDGEYAECRTQCEEAAKNLGVKSLRDVTKKQLHEGMARLSGVVYRRACHVICEIERTILAADGVRDFNWPTVGELMYDRHVSLRNDYEVSCIELDAVVDIAKGIGLRGGVYGCRMTGGGFGGCCVALVKTDCGKAITNKIAAEYTRRTSIEPTIFASRPAAGASILTKWKRNR